jgi:hypothetical protein
MVTSSRKAMAVPIEYVKSIRSKQLISREKTVSKESKGRIWKALPVSNLYRV